MFGVEFSLWIMIFVFIILIKSAHQFHSHSAAWWTKGKALYRAHSYRTENAFLSSPAHSDSTPCMRNFWTETILWIKASTSQLKRFTHNENDINGFPVNILLPLLSHRMTEISGCSVETPVRILHCSEKAEDVYFEKKEACVCVWVCVGEYEQVWCNMCFKILPLQAA